MKRLVSLIFVLMILACLVVSVQPENNSKDATALTPLQLSLQITDADIRMKEQLFRKKRDEPKMVEWINYIEFCHQWARNRAFPAHQINSVQGISLFTLNGIPCLRYVNEFVIDKDMMVKKAFTYCEQ